MATDPETLMATIDAIGAQKPAQTIGIHTLSAGYMVKLGCVSVGFRDIKTMMDAIRAYLERPHQAESYYWETVKDPVRTGNRNILAGRAATHDPHMEIGHPIPQAPPESAQEEMPATRGFTEPEPPSSPWPDDNDPR